ncbi:sodium/potassium/calcium exchanger 2 isoform 1-T1 [Lycaon pictus]|uniref:Solute carrier family 24 member 2 n=2 Tax=Canis lupus familiaris TaxID=9615 RepID=A0A8C0RD99_CANLF|nr:sodium/potassium/calcium exchanger 2 isoform X1 [Canis lupus familiaris]XP_025288991.1 sodium/potassium/calcium exchanger 2 isoform X1 [Canis lupus dingo]XP_035553151.1 sodium/potassium/calcium exchanger 2 isoform X1 [Canis lupus dingo]XP_038408432.1 sodium/potassium/calcium exchanger 2 isoform X1 [Canis lupus familiaris]XP_038408433.1 sodium/potassium/calcium exchanger 2 isoform X1 [Canis lupus familiaris]XP_038515468.1 sodium/potassium/calcium exchanger 2 isoform X1 [Canis lupus familiari|eukprot:XP_005626726.1 sodium/potassium/calcium exchanger 2 isoform X1 [Canis lupus familiaris]
MDLHQSTAITFLEKWCLDKSLSGCRRHYNVRKKLKLIRILGLLMGLVAISTVSFSISAFSEPETQSTEEVIGASGPRAIHGYRQRTLLDLNDKILDYTPQPPLSQEGKSENTTDHAQGDYPRDIFSLEERRKGAIILHVIGMIYMFIALAIVCDEFFVPSLTVITEKLGISDDVAGATFMAAGGSAPELFTSLIGVFIAHSNVGIGTIVGSAVFNILFVIGMCALFSREILNLTWWPLFRDVSFYIVDLIMLIIFFLDNVIMWWESLLLLTAYFGYVVFMKFNVQVERWVKQMINRNKVVKVTAPEAQAKSSTARDKDEQALPAKPRLQRGGSSASLHNSLMRNSIFQLMIHTLDPLAEELGSYGKLKYYDTMTEEGRFREKASILHKIAKKKCQVDENERQNGAANHVEKIELPNSTSTEVEMTTPSDASEPVQNGNLSHTIEAAEAQTTETGEDEEDQPLSLAWPSNPRKQVTFLIVFPIVFPLWITLPDVRKPSSRKFFPITFFGSITWIAVFSYLMVWWAHQVGETIGISEEIMGLTILAAGTSIPDLITSVIVARKGLGDMAVSSSVGSNIFDITVGLPLPWLLYTIIHRFQPVAVSSNGLFCAIVLLFIMLLFVILSIALCKWRMNKVLGFIMFGLYFVFLVVSVLLEDRILVCPVSI